MGEACQDILTVNKTQRKLNGSWSRDTLLIQFSFRLWVSSKESLPFYPAVSCSKIETFLYSHQPVKNDPAAISFDKPFSTGNINQDMMFHAQLSAKCEMSESLGKNDIFIHLLLLLRLHDMHFTDCNEQNMEPTLLVLFSACSNRYHNAFPLSSSNCCWFQLETKYSRNNIVRSGNNICLGTLALGKLRENGALFSFCFFPSLLLSLLL